MLAYIGFVALLVFGGYAVYAGVILWAIAGAFASRPSWGEYVCAAVLVLGGLACVWSALANAPWLSS